jgi:hypothetical protein
MMRACALLWELSLNATNWADFDGIQHSPAFSGHYATLLPFGLWLPENRAPKLPTRKRLWEYLCDLDG